MIDAVPEDALVSKEETFGPVLPILSVRDDDEAAALANRTNLGLQAAVFTSSLPRAFWYADRVRSGSDTGWGRGGIEEFTDPQTVVIDLGDVN